MDISLPLVNLKTNERIVFLIVNNLIDSETIQHYDYEGKEYSIKLYYLEDQPIKAFVSFQIVVFLHLL